MGNAIIHFITQESGLASCIHRLGIRQSNAKGFHHNKEDDKPRLDYKYPWEWVHALGCSATTEQFHFNSFDSELLLDTSPHVDIRPSLLGAHLFIIFLSTLALIGFEGRSVSKTVIPASCFVLPDRCQEVEGHCVPSYIIRYNHSTVLSHSTFPCLQVLFFPPLILFKTILPYCNYDSLASLEILGCSGATIFLKNLSKSK